LLIFVNFVDFVDFVDVAGGSSLKRNKVDFTHTGAVARAEMHFHAGLFLVKMLYKYRDETK